MLINIVRITLCMVDVRVLFEFSLQLGGLSGMYEVWVPAASACKQQLTSSGTVPGLRDATKQLNMWNQRATFKRSWQVKTKNEMHLKLVLFCFLLLFF